ncbi:MAG: hypothetical protein QXY39_00715 [Thermofilaceae archaeon]
MGRVLRWIRMASPHPRENILLVGRGDAQSLAALELVTSVEKGYDASIRVIEVGARPALQGRCTTLNLDYEFYKADYETYTGFRLSALPYISGYKDALVVLPDTVEDLAAYALGEVFLGDRRGTKLDSQYRVAYPLGAVSFRELFQLFPSVAREGRTLFERSRAREVVEWALLSSPTLCNATVRALLELNKVLNGSKIFKPALRRV